MKTLFSPLAALVLALVSSCATPEAVLIEEAPLIPQPTAAPASSVEKLTSLANDGLRLGDMLTLPDDNQLRSTTALKKEGEATIITSPPTE